MREIYYGQISALNENISSGVIKGAVNQKNRPLNSRGRFLRFAERLVGYQPVAHDPHVAHQVGTLGGLCANTDVIHHVANSGMAATGGRDA